MIFLPAKDTVNVTNGTVFALYRRNTYFREINCVARVEPMKAISDIATNVVRNDKGLWVARSQRAVSYPDEGNEACLAIEDRSYWFSHRNKVIVHLVQTFPPDGALFDVGGGNGYVSMALQQAGIQAIVVEPGPDGALNAKKRGLPVIHSTLQDAGFKKESVAAFGLFDVLEHIERDRAFLETLHACLVEDGLLYLTVPAFNALWSFNDERGGHFRRYTTRLLDSKLTSAGFTVRYCSYFFAGLVPAILVFRSIPSRLRLRRSHSRVRTKREHTKPSGVAGRLWERYLTLELNRMKEGKRIPLGSSCIAVAQKRNLVNR